MLELERRNQSNQEQLESGNRGAKGYTTKYARRPQFLEREAMECDLIELLKEALADARDARKETAETLTGFRLAFIIGRLEMALGVLEALKERKEEETTWKKTSVL